MTTRHTLILGGFVLPILAALAFVLVATAPAGSATGLAHPDLGMARLADFTLDRPAGGRVLLRFSATIVNVGNGPMELNATRASTSSAFDVVQRIYGSGGSATLSAPGVGLVFDYEQAYAFKRGIVIGPDCAGGRLLFRFEGDHPGVVTLIYGDDREVHPEGGAPVFAFAEGFDCPAVQLRDMPYDGQPETEPGMLSRKRAVCLAEAVEDKRQEFGADPLSRVAYADLDVRVDPLEPDLHAPAPRCELDGIR